MPEDQVLRRLPLILAGEPPTTPSNRFQALKDTDLSQGQINSLFTPEFYTPDDTTPGALTANDLIAHLGGIDTALETHTDQYGTPVADFPSLRAVPVADRADKQLRYVEDTTNPGIYAFDTAGVGADDGLLIIVPDVGTGRWFRRSGGGLLPGAHDLGGAEHIADTLANLNTKISDAKLDEFFQFNADQLDNPNNADWAVNALAPAAADSNNNGLTVRLFDDTTEEGVGFSLRVPPGATNLKIAPKGRPETGPPAARTVGLKLYQRGIPDDAAPEAWSAGTVLTDIDIPTTTEFFQYDAQTITLASLGITAGELTQFELTRVDPAGGTELVGDWDLLQLEVGFS